MLEIMFFSSSFLPTSGFHSSYKMKNSNKKKRRKIQNKNLCGMENIQIC